MTITYSCIANGRAVLADLALTGGSYQVSDTFLRNPLMSQEHFSPSNAVATDFQQVLGKYMVKYNKTQDNSLMSTLRSQVAEVKSVMTQNIHKLLETEERLNIFPDRTDDLQTTAKDFKTRRKILKWIWQKHFKKIIIISMAILLSIIIILLSTNVIPT